MTKLTDFKHIAMQFANRTDADTLFCEILGLKVSKEFNLSDELSYQIFGFKKTVDVVVYCSNICCFEIFISDEKISPGFSHVCIEVSDIDDFILKCESHGFEIIKVKKGDRTLVFMKDKINNLFEVKEK